MGASKAAWEDHRYYPTYTSITMGWDRRNKIVTLKNTDKVRRLPAHDKIDFKGDTVRIWRDGEVIFQGQLPKGEYSVLFRDNKEIRVKIDEHIP